MKSAISADAKPTSFFKGHLPPGVLLFSSHLMAPLGALPIPHLSFRTYTALSRDKGVSSWEVQLLVTDADAAVDMDMVQVVVSHC